MKFEISDLRLLLTGFYISFENFLSDAEVNAFNDNSKSCESLFKDGIYINSEKVRNQDLFYDRLDLYIRLLQELYKFRPLPF